mmetsp:Transcript_6458/g.17791  ORF Transcript_6458/g.17791 Transcript_6458/m.17791 type:complete len:534 (+) Transcript_6458:42-1643(+)
MAAGGPAYQPILNDQAQVDKGEGARQASFVGAIAIADLVKTTLGPKGMDKILQSTTGRGEGVTVTNDGATILQAIQVDNAAAKVLIDIAKTQDDEVGDGTTSVTVLCGELLREAEKLVAMRIHPMTIVAGWRQAQQVAREALEASAMDHAADPVAFREDLMNIARTTLSSKLVFHEKELFAKLAVDAVTRIKGSLDLERIQILKMSGGKLSDSFLEEGYLLKKSIGVGQPKRIEGAKIMVANTSMDTDKVKIFGSRVKVDSMTKVAAIEEAEKDKMRAKCKKIIDHGINVFINRQLIYNYPEQLFKEAGVMAIEHSDFDGTERLAAVLGADIVSTFDNPEETRLGSCQKISEIMIGEDKVIKFSGCAENEACTIVLRGASCHILDEAERSLHDALAVLYQTVQDTRVVHGGGSAEMAMAAGVLERTKAVDGKEHAAVEAFAKALQQLPMILADNAGYDSQDLVGKLKAVHAQGKTTMGIDFTKAVVADMHPLGIMESFRSKMSQLCSAAEAAEMIIRVDDIIKNAPRQRDGGM